jgi:hypothetical protein
MYKYRDVGYAQIFPAVKIFAKIHQLPQFPKPQKAILLNFDSFKII